MDPELPQTLGHEAAGVVDEIGEGVADVAVGDRVFGSSADGATRAEVAVLDSWAPVPPSLDFAEAATLPAAVETATRALDQLDVRDGSSVLVSGASGSVGSAALQLTVVRGARVIGTASPANRDHLRSLGAEPVAYGEGLVERVRALAPTGRRRARRRGKRDPARPDRARRRPGARREHRRLRRSPAAQGAVQQRRRRPRTACARGHRRADRVRAVLTPGVHTFPLAEVAVAHRVGEEGRRRGKLVLVVDPSHG